MKKPNDSIYNDFDINAQLFLQIRKFVMTQIGVDIKEKISANINSYFCSEGGICYIKAYADYVHIGWFRGVNIDDKFDNLFGNGKVIRGHRLISLDSIQKEAIVDYINQTKMFLIEHNETNKLRRMMRRMTAWR